MNTRSNIPYEDIQTQVQQALDEDIGSGDRTAALVDAQAQSDLVIIARESGVVCGLDWVEMAFRLMDESIKVTAKANDGDHVQENDVIVRIQGPSRAVLTGERVALNFLQLLSGTASKVAEFAAHTEGSHTKVLDTRKTIPGFRLAQKYAVRCGGGANHRIGLYDAILIKENHIAAAGSITAACDAIRDEQVPVICEVENFDELNEAIAAKVDRIMLDDFSDEQVKEAIAINAGRVKLEVSGGVDLPRIRRLADMGVDCISIGGLTKHVRAMDFSMRPASRYL